MTATSQQTTTVTPAERTYILTPAEYAETVARVAKINDRAAAKGLDGRYILHATETTVEDRLATGRIEHRPAYRVTLTGTPPRYADWKFTARVEWLPDSGGLLVSAIPGTPDGTIDRDALIPGWCGHCKTRRNRRKIFVAINTRTGEQIQIGATCLLDFTGHRNVIAWDDPIGGLTDYLDGLDDLDGGLRFAVPSTRRYLAIAAALTRAHGFTPTTGYASMSTRDQAHDVLSPRQNATRAELDHADKIANRATDLVDDGTVDAIVDWANDPARSGDSDYVLNLRSALAETALPARAAGLIASAPASHNRHLAKTANDANARSRGHVGIPGEKITRLPVTVGTYHWYDTMYGRKAWVTFVTADGAILKWNTSSEAFVDAEGDTVDIAFTVDAHAEWNDVPETHIKRARLAKSK